MTQREDDHALLMAECRRLMTENEQLLQAIDAARRDLLMYAGEDPDDWDASTRDAMAQMQAVSKARPQQPDGPADILDRLRVASRNGIMCDVCDRAIIEIERLRATLDQLLCDAQQNGFIGENIDDAISWSVRQMAAANKLRREIQRRADMEPGGHVLDDDLRKAGVTR